MKSWSTQARWPYYKEDCQQAARDALSLARRWVGHLRASRSLWGPSDTLDAVARKCIARCRENAAAWRRQALTAPSRKES